MSKIDLYKCKKISKELIEEITGIPNNAIKSISIGKSIVSVRKINGRVEEYNVYELAYKCKEWAYKQGYSIVDGIDTIGNEICYLMKITGCEQDYYYEQLENYINSFKACQSILDKKIQ